MRPGMAIVNLILLFLFSSPLVSYELTVGADDMEHADQVVTYMPGFEGDQFPSKHYAGYFTINKATGKRLYYYFVTSEANPMQDPLILWVNGGPGCSSLDGFVDEHGPFKYQFVDGELKATLNPYSWSKAASLIYLDSPSGVGLSYSETESDYHTNDTQTATDTHAFLQLFLEEYSEFASNPFFIAGESYAGVYVPTLANLIYDSQLDGQGSRPINLKGYSIGNGVTDPVIDGDAILRYAWRHTLLSDALYAEMQEACSGSYRNVSRGTECHKLTTQAYNSLHGINIYNILLPCRHHKDLFAWALAAHQANEAAPGGLRWPLGGSVQQGERIHNWASLSGGELGHSPPCLDHRELWAFANDPEVRRAIHAEPIDVAGRFDECSDRLRYTAAAGSMLPLHKKLLAAGLKVLIYSGDQDLCVPYTGSQYWTSSLGLKVLAPWHSWHARDDQVAGYRIEYEGLTFATVLGAGHAVPEMRPAEALALLSHFLAKSVGLNIIS